MVLGGWFKQEGLKVAQIPMKKALDSLDSPFWMIRTLTSIIFWNSFAQAFDAAYSYDWGVRKNSLIHLTA